MYYLPICGPGPLNMWGNRNFCLCGHAGSSEQPWLWKLFSSAQATYLAKRLWGLLTYSIPASLWLCQYYPPVLSHVLELTCREFSNERTRVERRETFRKLRMKENFSKAFEGYFQWIIRAGERIVHFQLWNVIVQAILILIDCNYNLLTYISYQLPRTISTLLFGSTISSVCRLSFTYHYI